jgi:hypothetical protein
VSDKNEKDEIIKINANTYCMFALVTPAIRGSHIPIAFYRSPTAPPKGLVLSAHALDLGAIVVMWDEAAAVGVVDVEEVFVAADAVQSRGRGERGEEGC